MGVNEGAAPGAIISARRIPANEVVAKLLVDFIVFLPLPVCRLKEPEFDIPPELLQATTTISGRRETRGATLQGRYKD
jgi:hypothetical protein